MSSSAENKLSLSPALPRMLALPLGRLLRAFAIMRERYALLSLRQRIVLGCLAVAVVLTGFAHLIEEVSAHWLAEHVPLSWVRQASTGNLAFLDATQLEPSRLPAEQQTLLRNRFAALRLPITNPPPYELVFRGGSKLGAAIFALPGGQIVVTDEFIAAHPDQRELLTEFATQLGHLHFEHALRSQVEHAPMGLMLAVMRDDSTRGIRLLSEAPPKLVHDPECVADARVFSDAVMRINP